MAETIRLRRDGTFTAHVDRQKIYCGLFDTPTIDYRFEVEIEADRMALDDRGFLIDNRDLESVFQCQEVSESCELLAEFFLTQVLMLCGDRRHFVKRCTVSLWAHPTAMITREFKRDA